MGMTRIFANQFRVNLRNSRRTAVVIRNTMMQLRANQQLRGLVDAKKRNKVTWFVVWVDVWVVAQPEAPNCTRMQGNREKERNLIFTNKNGHET